ncbi:hypothetical protein V5O48_005816 [Marasmius crinis-equi]|uniref:NADH dehydrogenase [ubiquinone] 1 alpha subcomplex assembly factor 3 n=1 Tax=Marasmius crinis-equi TaxID=585013 RepID=A0ABR3FL98_9AGAR
MQAQKTAQALRRLVSTSSRIPYTQTYRRHVMLPIATRSFHTNSIRRSGPRKEPFVNILEGDIPPPVQVQSITPNGIQLTDGLILPSSTVFLEGKVYLWDVPMSFWEGWQKEHFDVFEVVAPRPEILILGTGKTSVQPPPFVREYLNGLGIQLDVMDTRNACSTYNLLSEEGRRVAAALLPLTPRPWHKSQIPKK